MHRPRGRTKRFDSLGIPADRLLGAVVTLFVVALGSGLRTKLAEAGGKIVGRELVELGPQGLRLGLRPGSRRARPPGRCGRALRSAGASAAHTRRGRTGSPAWRRGRSPPWSARW